MTSISASNINFNVSKDKKLNNLNSMNQFQLPLASITTIQSSAIPGSLIYIKDSSGTTYYLPLSTAVW